MEYKASQSIRPAADIMQRHKERELLTLFRSIPPKDQAQALSFIQRLGVNVTTCTIQSTEE